MGRSPTAADAAAVTVRAPRDSGRVVFVQSSRMAHHPRHHYRLAAALAAAGYHVSTLAQPDLTPGHIDAVPVDYLPVRRGRLARMASGPLTMWRAIQRRPAAIHVVSLDLLPWAVVARKLWRGVVVYDSNEEYDTYMLIKEWLPERTRAPLRGLVRWLEPWLAARLDAATTALPATQRKFEKAGVRSVQVRNFPPASIADPVDRGEEFSYDVLVGGSLPDDQMPLLAATAARLEKTGPQGLRWLVAARNYGPREQRLLEAALGERRVKHLFELRYNLPFTEMRGLMASSRIAFVLYGGDANYAARIPIRIFEYMAAGIPFVAPDLPTTSEFIEGRGVAVLARAGDPDAYADSLSELLRDRERQREMSERGPAVVREEYSWERESGKLVELYQELLIECSPAAAQPAVRACT